MIRPLAVAIALVATTATATDFAARWVPGVGGTPPTSWMLRECIPTAAAPCCAGPAENCAPLDPTGARWHDKAPFTAAAACPTSLCRGVFAIQDPPPGFLVTPFFYVDARAGAEISAPSNSRSVTVGLTTTTTTTTSTTTTTRASTTSTTLPAGVATCTSPQPIPPEGGALAFVTTGASVLKSNPSTAPCNVSDQGPERVFRWVPPRTGPARIETCSTTATDVDTVVYLRTTATCAAGPDASCNDDTRGCGTTSDVADPHRGSVLSPSVTAGVPVLIVVDGFNGSRQAGRVLLTVTPPPPSTATTSTTTTTTTTRPPPPPAPSGFTIEPVSGLQLRRALG